MACQDDVPLGHITRGLGIGSDDDNDPEQSVVGLTLDGETT